LSPVATRPKTSFATRPKDYGRLIETAIALRVLWFSEKKKNENNRDRGETHLVKPVDQWQEKSSDRGGKRARSHLYSIEKEKRSMLLRLPPTLHYPITVLSLLKRPGDKVKRDEAIFCYIYYTVVSEGDGLGNKVSVRREYPCKFQSAVDGEIMSWRISTGDVIKGP
jgi:hypothetical protein